MNFHEKRAFDFFKANKDTQFGNLSITGVIGSKLDVLCKCGAVLLLSIARLERRKQCSSSCLVGLHIHSKDIYDKAASSWLKNNTQRIFDDWTIVSHSLTNGRNFMAKCVCGGVKDIDMYSIVDGRSGNCGCKHLDRISATNMERYGVENVFSMAETHKKSKATLMKRYNVTTPMHRDEFKQKVVKTNLERYGVEHYTQTEEYRHRVRKTKVKNNNVTIFLGSTATELREVYNMASSAIRKLLKTDITDEAKVLILESHEESCRTNIETMLYKLLADNNVEHKYNNKLGTFFPDFRIDSHKLIIEADGEYFHNEKRKNNKKGSTGKTYHQDRLKNAEDNGYKLIAFHGTEITDKFPIVESIIKNKLGMSTKIGARKTVIKEVPTKEAAQFFQDNHLMGKGSGRAFGLYCDNTLVTCIRVVKKKDGLDISRFAHVLNINVVGGFSKLLKHVERTIKPAFIQTFIDRRYGQGFYLEGLGFKKETEHLSFCWYLKGQRYHRMKFPGNSGYDAGAEKIWDAGQAKWVKYCAVI